MYIHMCFVFLVIKLLIIIIISNIGCFPQPREFHEPGL